jgi:hypothetical protein
LDLFRAQIVVYEIDTSVRSTARVPRTRPTANPVTPNDFIDFYEVGLFLGIALANVLLANMSDRERGRATTGTWDDGFVKRREPFYLVSGEGALSGTGWEDRIRSMDGNDGVSRFIRTAIGAVAA